MSDGRGGSRACRGSALLICVLAVGCGSDDRSQAPDPFRAIDDVPVWTASLELRIGSVDDPDYALTTIRFLEVGPDGTIFTLHPQEQLIRMFNADGELIRTIGGRGAGPGEFQQALTMGWVADTLWVLDARGYRFSQFAAAGTYLGSFSVPYAVVDDPNALQPARAEGLLDDGTVHGSPPAFSSLVAEGILTHTVPVLMSRDGRVTDTLPSIPLGRNFWVIYDPNEPRRAQMSRAHPFPDGPLWWYVPRERAMIVLERWAPLDPGNAHFRLSKLTFTGDTVLTREYPFEPVAVRREEVDSVLDVVSSAIAEIAFFNATPARAREWVEATLDAPSFRPGVTDFRLARDGSIWLSLGPDGAGQDDWLVLDAAGEPVARVALPSSVRPLAIDRPLVWGAETDDLDVPYVVRYRIDREAP